MTPGLKAASHRRALAAAVSVNVKSVAPRTSIRSNTASAIACRPASDADSTDPLPWRDRPS